MLTIAIHTSEPNEFISELNRSINDEPSNDTVGDLDGLEQLRITRAQYGR